MIGDGVVETMVETPAVHGEAVAESVNIKLGLIFEFLGRHKAQKCLSWSRFNYFSGIPRSRFEMKSWAIPRCLFFFGTDIKYLIGENGTLEMCQSLSEDGLWRVPPTLSRGALALKATII